MASHSRFVGDGGGGRDKFFKVLLPGSFEISLSLPPKFAAGLVVMYPWGGAATAMLRDRSTGRSWGVGLYRHRDAGHRVSFTGSGWRGFVSANAISAGQLLVFEHLGCLDFAVDRFDASGCCCGNGGHEVSTRGVEQHQHMTTTRTEVATDKESGVKRRRRSPSSTAVVTSVSGDDDKETLCRRIERPYQLRFLELSKKFCDRVGWSSSRDVVLCAAAGDIDDKRWPVSVKVSSKSGSGMMCAGWAEFAQDKGLTISDVRLRLRATTPTPTPSTRFFFRLLGRSSGPHPQGHSTLASC